MIANLNQTTRVTRTPLQQRPREPDAVSAALRPALTQQSRYLVIGAILLVALLAFEIFNFDTTQFALRDLLGDVRFAGVQWATILAIAFCGIDFAGLLRVFTPDGEGESSAEMVYLMAAWLLGATMNAIMTWWAVTLTLLNHNVGNEVLPREQLLTIVPVFVAVLVWLTRILFIGALSLAGGRLMAGATAQRAAASARSAAAAEQPAVQPQPQPAGLRPAVMRPSRLPVTPAPLVEAEELPTEQHPLRPSRPTSAQPLPVAPPAMRRAAQPAHAP